MSDAVQKKWDDSLISMGLGALVVVVSGILLFNYFNSQAPKFNKVSQAGNKADTATLSAINQSIGTATLTPSASTVASPTATSKASPTQIAKATVKPTVASTVKATQIAKASSTPSNTATPAPSNVAQASNSNLNDKYTVVAGDSLWKISQKYYSSGYDWKRIAQANKITNPSVISAGTVLEIPKAELASSTSTVKENQSTVSASTKPSSTPVSVAQATNQSVSQTANTNTVTYTVTKGDSLWSIAADKCNDPYVWSKIAKQNGLIHPGTIHSGNVLTFACQ